MAEENTSELPNMIEPDKDATAESPTEEVEEEEDSALSVDELLSDEQDTSSAEQDKSRHRMNVPLQKMQQRQTTLERNTQRRLDELADSVSALTDRIEDRGRATQGDRQQLRDAQKALEELQGDSDDVVTKGELTKLLRSLNASGGQVTDDALKKMDEMHRSIKQIQDQYGKERDGAAAARFEAEWDKKHGHIAGRIQEFIDKATDNVLEDDPDIEGNALHKAIVIELKHISRAANAKAGQLAGSDKPSRRSPKSAKGADAVKSGAKAGVKENDGVPRDRNGLPQFFRE